MSAETEPDASETGAPETGAASRPVPDERSWVWHLQRATALALIVLVPVHVVSAVLLVDPATVDIPTLTDRWQQPLWQVLDWLLVTVGLGHAALAVAGRIPVGNRWLRGAYVGWCLACGTLAAAATVAIATFDLP
ncbi:MAG: hypothetical protein JJU45_11735 [Acidimicrobiia bacterium]|nr:hypothetical protein [Acidimicrobiia bacterium]